MTHSTSSHFFCAQQPNLGKPPGDFNLSSGAAAPSQQGAQIAAAASQAQANAYDAYERHVFEGVPPGAAAGAGAGAGAGEGGFGGFSQGFGQDALQQLPASLQNFSADVSRAGVGAEERRAAPTLDSQNAAVQQTLSVVSGSSAFGATTNVDILMTKQKVVAQVKHL